MAKWTRELIISEILKREAAGLAVTAGGKNGVGCGLYQAARRIFGSWQNAIAATGISRRRAASPNRWTPGKILLTIRSLGRRHRPLSSNEIRDRHTSLVAAARRVFGSWSKAVVAAGVDPAKLRRVNPWTRDRIIEEILTRAINNKALGASTVTPRSISEAGRRIFGSWKAALAAAGIDPARHAFKPTVPGDMPAFIASGATSTQPSDLNDINIIPRFERPPGQSWTAEGVIAGIHLRLRNGRPINAKSVYRDDRPLYRAATRRHGNWRNAMIAAGLNPAEHQTRAARLAENRSPTR